MAKQRKCERCKRGLIPNGSAAVDTDKFAKAHCPSPTCDWCGACYRNKLAQCGLSSEPTI